MSLSTESYPDLFLLTLLHLILNLVQTFFEIRNDFVRLLREHQVNLFELKVNVKFWCGLIYTYLGYSGVLSRMIAEIMLLEMMQMLVL